MYITAYYFRAHTYTLVPRHVREDMQWMADHGTDAIAIGVLEQDLFAAVENIQQICAEADRAGLEVWAVPSRWGGLVAGSPKVPSIFCARHPHALSCDINGTPLIDWIGTKASVHHPDTFAFFCDTLTKMLELFPISGVIWDEVKNLDERDYSPAARNALADRDIDDLATHIQSTANFFDRVGAAALQIKPDLRLAMFLYGWLTGPAVTTCAAIKHLHHFGCDGRPLRAADVAGRPHERKQLLEHGPMFIEQARRHGKQPLLLIENHNLAEDLTPVMDQRLPEVFDLGAEHLLYYYYPRSLRNPDENMAVIGRHLKARRAATRG